MNVLLWILQIILFLKFVSVAYTHGLRTDQPKMRQGIQKMGAAARPLLAIIALCVLLGGVSLFLPVVSGFLAWLTPFAASFLAVMMLLSIIFHTRCRDKPNVVVSLVLFAMAVLLAYGRWVLAP
jgi:hypothetical protein